MTDIHIPAEAFAAGRDAFYDAEANRKSTDDALRAAFLAIVEAWPTHHVHEWERPWLGGIRGTDLILPLTETADDQP